MVRRGTGSNAGHSPGRPSALGAAWTIRRASRRLTVDFRGLFAVAEEDVICGIGDAAKGAGLMARALGGAAVGVDPLHGGDIRERPRFRGGSRRPA